MGLARSARRLTAAFAFALELVRSNEPGGHLYGDEAERIVTRTYRLILGRSPEPEALDHHARLLTEGRLTARGLGARLGASEELSRRVGALPADRIVRSARGARGGKSGRLSEDADPGAAEQATGETGQGQGQGQDQPPGFVDVRRLVAELSVEELAARADELVRSMEDPSALLAKPCSSLREAPDLLSCFGQVLGRLQPLPGMTVLDFGAGTCWTSMFLAQLGCRVLSMDISPAMLDLGRARYERMGLFGDCPEPSFLLFDGHRMEIDDASVDRVLSFDAFHHVPNPAEVISEMGRVLRDGGIAAFSEPGPHHSEYPQSQHDMRRYGVVENDVILEDVWVWAQAAGFAGLEVAVFSPVPRWTDLDGFAAFIDGDEAAAAEQAGSAREMLANRRMFVLRKAGRELVDSREATGLAADLRLVSVTMAAGGGTGVIEGTCEVLNTGRNQWLASSGGIGAVRLGIRARGGYGPSEDIARAALPAPEGVAPGGSATIPFRIELPSHLTASGGVHPAHPIVVELDLVAEGITWFAVNGTPPLEIALDPTGDVRVLGGR